MGLFDALGGLFGGDEEPPVEAVEDPGEPPIPVGTVREAADDAAAARPELDLDFSPASLARLDDAVADREASFDDPSDADALVEDEEVLALGAYLGETLIRTHGGGWEYHGGWTVRLAPDGDVVEVPAFQVAARSLAGDPSFRSVADSAASQLAGDGEEPDAVDAEAADEVIESQGGEDATAESQGEDTENAESDADGAEDAQRSGPTDDESPESPAEAPREENEELAKHYRTAAEQLVAAWPDRGLDGTVVSLAHLDRLVEAAGDEVRDGTGLEALGGYFAEVLRGQHDAVWRDRDGEVLVLAGPDGTVELTPYALAAAVTTGEGTFVEAYAEAAADCGLEPSVLD